MKIVFLDFDGVLNHDAWFSKISNHVSRPMASRKPEEAFDPECVGRVERLCDETGAVIVVSSSWRYGRSVDELRRLLRAAGLTRAKIMDATPISGISRDEASKDYPPEVLECIPQHVVLSPTRGREIAQWLEQSAGSDIEAIVILDDDRDLAPLEHRHVKTSFHGGGLRDEHIETAKRLLSRPWPPTITVVQP
jgi:HAD domain in Swiss Army Knife RNA repair proteins